MSAPVVADSFVQLLSVWTAVPTAHALVASGVAEAIGLGEEVAVKDIAQRCSLDVDLLYRALRFVSGLGVFVEVALEGEGEADTSNRRFKHSPLSAEMRQGGMLFSRVAYMNSSLGLLAYAQLPNMLKAKPEGEVEPSGFARAFGKPAFEWLAEHPEQERQFAQTMMEFSSHISGPVGCTYEWPSTGHVVDVGGSNGHLLMQILGGRPELKGTVFDLPTVAEHAKLFLSGAVPCPVPGYADLVSSVGNRVGVVGGSFFDPQTLEAVKGADVYVLKWILHDWSDQHCQMILTNLRAVMAPHSKIVICDHVVPHDVNAGGSDSGARARVHHLDVHMAVMTQGGKERTLPQWTALAEAAGLKIKSSKHMPAAEIDLLELEAMEDAPVARKGA